MTTQRRFTEITAGLHHACGLTADGTAYCWGDNTYGQLGIGGFASSPIPTAVPGLTFRKIVAGGLSTCGITTAGSTYCWGDDYAGQLGNGVSAIDNTGSVGYDHPQPVRGSVAFASISPGPYSTCALTNTGAAYCWGLNDVGELGNGLAYYDDTGSMDYSSPQPVVGDPQFVSISVGGLHACGLSASGAAYCWGNNSRGAVGTGSDVPAIVSAPTEIPSLSFMSLSAGGNPNGSNDFSCGILGDGTAWCWGANASGELGIGTISSYDATPQEVTGGVTFLTR